MPGCGRRDALGRLLEPPLPPPAPPSVAAGSTGGSSLAQARKSPRAMQSVCERGTLQKTWRREIASERKAAPIPSTRYVCTMMLSPRTQGVGTTSYVPGAPPLTEAPPLAAARLMAAASFVMVTSRTVERAKVPTASRCAPAKAQRTCRPPQKKSHASARHAPCGSARRATSAVLKPSPKPPAVLSPPLVVSWTPVSSARGCRAYVWCCSTTSSSARTRSTHTSSAPHTKAIVVAEPPSPS